MEKERKAFMKYYNLEVRTYKIPSGLHVCATYPSLGLFQVEDEE